MKKIQGLPLVVSHWLCLDWWEIHEAAFILTEWPDNMIAIGTQELIRDQLDRGVIYAPKERILKKMLKKSTSDLLSELKKSVENGELNAVSRNLLLSRSYGKNISYLLRSHDVILWSLLKEFILPIKIQNELDIHQLEDFEKSPKTVQNQIVAQHIFSINPKISKQGLLDHPWIKKFGTGNDSNDCELKAVGRDYDEFYSDKKEIGKNKKKRGRPSKNQIFSQVLKAIPEVLQKREDGICAYHIPFLKITTVVAIKIKIELIGQEQLFKMTGEEFLNEFLQGEVIRLYLKEASPSILKLVRNICRRELSHYYSHEKINFLSNDYRKTLTIGQLCELNKELCLARFTKEERNLIEKIENESRLGVEVVFTEEEKKLFKPKIVRKIAGS